MEHTFKKHEQKDGSFRIGYYVDNKFQKFVNEDKPYFVEWNKKNTPEVIDYVAPSKPPVKPIGDLRTKAKRKVMAIRNSQFMERVWEASPEYAQGILDAKAIDTMNKTELKAFMESL